MGHIFARFLHELGAHHRSHNEISWCQNEEFIRSIKAICVGIDTRLETSTRITRRDREGVSIVYRAIAVLSGAFARTGRYCTDYVTDIYACCRA